MRSATKTFVGLAGIGVMIAAARAGMPVPSTAATATPTDSATATATPTPTETPKATATPTPKTTKKSGSGSSGSSSSSGSTTTATTQKSSAISYRYGVVQVSVTKKNGTITAVKLNQATATKGRDAAFPSLVQATLDNNGTSFGNLSGATYTTDAFKKAVNNALAKF